MYKENKPALAQSTTTTESCITPLASLSLLITGTTTLARARTSDHQRVYFRDSRSGDQSSGSDGNEGDDRELHIGRS